MPTAIHPVCFALGSITRKPGIKNNTTTARDYIKITILFDHDVVDGAPAARFTSRLVDLIESGYGL
ncbi:MAG TPA: 2-oxo acid dehydrogenase subunit E2 [Spirochaetota bacterium]|nr:2-oxo acid dehydrogenase subunit E2 [Spirochaetota bacterium]